MAGFGVCQRKERTVDWFGGGLRAGQNLIGVVPDIGVEAPGMSLKSHGQKDGGSQKRMSGHGNERAKYSKEAGELNFMGLKACRSFFCSFFSGSLKKAAEQRQMH